MRFRGLALSETVVALFLLLLACTIFFSLLHRTLNHQARSRTQMMATWAAERRLAQIQADATALGQGFYNVASWSGLLATTGDPDFPGISLSARVRDLPLDSPCSGLEAGFPVGSRRTMNSALKQVQVTASWGSSATQRVVLCTSLGGPLAPFGNLKVTRVGGASPVPHNGSINFTAQAYDSGNNPIPDLIYSWYCKPISGSATVQASNRTGSAGTLAHKLRRPDGSWISFGPDPVTGGPRRCKVQVRVRYGGIDSWGESDEILLAP